MTNLAKSNNDTETSLDDLVKDWYIVNDTVMGGRSDAELYWDNEQKTFLFTGRVSLENNGGFASVRGIFPKLSFVDAQKICIKVKGDGQDYQLRLRDNKNMDGVAYVQSFTTEKDTWQVIELGVKSFKPTWRGRPVPNYRPLKVDNIRQVSFMIADKQAGPFQLYFKEVRPCHLKGTKDLI